MRKSLSLAVAAALLCVSLCPSPGAYAQAADPYADRLRELLADFYARKGCAAGATEHYRQAYNLDPALARGVPVDGYVAQRLKAAEEKKN